LRAPLKRGPKRAAGTIRRELLPGSDPSPFDSRLSAERSVAFASVPLSELKRIGHGPGGGAADRRTVDE
jgi:hypothetical protein